MGLVEVEELKARCSELEELYQEAVRAKDEAIEERNKATVLIALQLEKETTELNSRIESLQTENENILNENDDLSIRLEYARNDLKTLQQKHIKLQIESEKCISKRDAALDKVKSLEKENKELDEEVNILLKKIRNNNYENDKTISMDVKETGRAKGTGREAVKEEEDERLELEPRPPITLKKSALEEDYNVHEELGKGKFGVVKRVTAKSSGAVYAAKYIKTSGALSGSSRDDVLREIDIMGRMHHKRLVSLLDAYDSARNIIMIMEFVSGGELFERVVDEDCLTEKEAAYYMYQLLQGLEHMHKKNILHLDLKPENIVCVSKNSWDVKLIDFGLAQELIPGSKMKALKGTPEFMAPEAANFESITKATDMWSVGVIAYILLSGLSPFMGDDNNETLSNVTAVEWDFDDEAFDLISDEAKDFISELLIKNPRKRNTVEDCLKHEWMKKSASTRAVKINTHKLKQFLAKRRWQKSVNALVAVRRLSSMSSLLGGLSKARPSVAPTLATVVVSSEDENTDEKNKAKRDDSTTKNEAETNEKDKTNKLENGETEVAKKDEKTSIPKVVNTKVKEKEIPKQPVFTKALNDVTIGEGESITLEVTIDGDPGCMVKWYKNGGDVKKTDSRSVVDHKDGRHALVIQNCDDDDMGEYCCVASNQTGRATTAGYLTVEVEEESEDDEESGPEGDPPVFEKEFTDFTAKEGDTVTLEVVISGVDYDLEWFKNAVDVEEGERFMFTTDGRGKHALVISDVEEDDMGEYCCVAQNSGGRNTCAGTLTIEIEEEDEEEEESEDETDEEFYEEKIVKPKKEYIEDFYALEEEIGRGRFGIVRKCVHLTTAIHFVAKSVKARPSQKEEFLREIDVMNALRHTNLCRIRDAFDKPREIIIVLEYNRGGDLLQQINEEPMSEPDTVAIVEQILDGVSYMHESGYMHLDLKPENVMFKHEGGTRIKLIDFSLARKYDPKVETKISQGTAEYVAPEVVNYEGVSPATDMWAIGVTTYMMLSGSSPFLSDSEADTFTNISQCKWKFTDDFEDVSDEAKDFITKLLVKSQKGRMTANECLQHPWITTVGRSGRKQRTSTISRVESLIDINSNMLMNGDLHDSISSVESFLRMNSVDNEDGKQSIGAKELESTLQTFLIKLKQVESERAELEEQLKAEEDKVESLEKVLDEKDDQQKDLDEKLSKLKKENVNLSKQVKSKNELLVKIGLLETERKGLEEEVRWKTKLQNTIEERYNNLKTKMEQYDLLEDKIYQYEREKKEINEVNQKLKEKLEEYQSIEKELEEKCSGSEKEKQTEVSKLKKGKDEADEKYKILRQENETIVSELTKKFTSMEQENKSLLEENKVLETRVKGLENELSKLNKDFNKVKEDLSKSNEEFEMIKSRTSRDFEVKVKSLTEEKSDMEKETKKLQKQKEETQKTCEKLASKLSKSYGEMERLKTTNTNGIADKLRKEVSELKKKLSTLEESSSQMKDEVKSRDEELEELQDKLDILTAENQRLFEMGTEDSDTGSEREYDYTDGKPNSNSEKLMTKVIDLESTIVAHESTMVVLKSEISLLQEKLSIESKQKEKFEEKIELQRKDMKRVKKEKSDVIDKYEDELEEALDCYEESKRELVLRYEKRIRDLEKANEADSNDKHEDVPNTVEKDPKSASQFSDMLDELKRLNRSRRKDSDRELVDVLRKQIQMFDDITNKDMEYVLNEKDAVARNFQLRLETLKVELDQCKEKLESYEQIRKEGNMALNEEVKELEQSVQEKGKKLLETRDALDALEKDKKLGLEMYACLQEDNRSIQHEIENTKQGNTELIHQLKSVEKQNEKLQKNHSKQKKELKRKAEDYGLLEEENKCFSAELDKLKEDKLEEYKLFAQIEERNGHLKKDLKQVRHELETIKKEYNELIELCERQKKDIQTKCEESESLNSDVAALNLQIEKGIDKYLSLEAEANALRHKTSLLEQETLEFKTNFDHISSEYVSLQSKYDKLGAQQPIKLTDDAYAVSHEELMSQKHERPLQSTVNLAAEKLKIGNIDIVKDNNQRLKGTFEERNDDLNKPTSEVQSLKKDISSLKQKLELVSEDNDKLREHLVECKQWQELMETSESVFAQNAEALNASGAKRELDREVLRNHIIESRQIDELHVVASIQSLTASKESRRADDKVTAKLYIELQEHCKNLQSSNDLKTVAIEKAVSEITRLQNDFKQVVSTVEELQKKNDKLQQECKVMEANLQSQFSDLQEAKEQLLKTSKENKEIRQKCHDLEEKNKLLANDYARLEEDSKSDEVHLHTAKQAIEKNVDGKKDEKQVHKGRTEPEMELHDTENKEPNSLEGRDFKKLKKLEAEMSKMKTKIEDLKIELAYERKRTTYIEDSKKELQLNHDGLKDDSKEKVKEEELEKNQDELRESNQEAENLNKENQDLKVRNDKAPEIDVLEKETKEKESLANQLKGVRHRILTCVQRPLEEARLPWNFHVSADDVILGRYSAWEKIKENITSLVKDREIFIRENKSLHQAWNSIQQEYKEANKEFETVKRERESIIKELEELKQGLMTGDFDQPGNLECLTDDLKKIKQLKEAELSRSKMEQGDVASGEAAFIHEAGELKKELDEIKKKLDDDTRQLELLKKQKQKVSSRLEELQRVSNTEERGEQSAVAVQEAFRDKCSQMEKLLDCSLRFDTIVKRFEGKWEALEWASCYGSSFVQEIAGHSQSREFHPTKPQVFSQEGYVTELEHHLMQSDTWIPCSFTESDLFHTGFEFELERFNTSHLEATGSNVDVMRDLVRKNHRIHELMKEADNLSKQLREQPIGTKQLKDQPIGTEVERSKDESNSVELEASRKEIERLQKEKAELNAFIKDSVAKQEATSAELETLRQGKKRMENEIEELNRYIKDSSITTLRQELKELQASAKTLSKEKEEITLEISTRDKKIALYEKEVMDLQNTATQGTGTGVAVRKSENGTLNGVQDELRKELREAKHNGASLEAELEQLNKNYHRKLKEEQEEMENKWAKRLRKECSELQADLAEKYNHDKRIWLKKEVELQNMIRQMKMLMDKRAKEFDQEKKRLERELANSKSYHDSTASLDSNSISDDAGEPTSATGANVEMKTDEKLSDRELRRVAFKLTSDEWSQLGTFLGVPERELNKLGALSMGHQEKAFRLLCLWRTRSSLGKTQIVSQLAVALEEIKRKDVAQFVVEQMMSGKPRKKFFGWLK